MIEPVYISAFATVSTLGATTAASADALFAGCQEGLRSSIVLGSGQGGHRVPVGRVALDLSEVWSGDIKTANNCLILHCLRELEDRYRDIAAAVPPSRVGVVIGTSTSGMREAETAFNAWRRDGAWPEDYDFSGQELGDPALVLASEVHCAGPAYSVSTACSSGAKALASAARLILAGVCDVVLCGGADSLCALTVNGFAALDALSPTVCNPFSRNRRGINLGEGAALFVLSRTPAELFLAGWGETSDAYHASAPHPEGHGAEEAVRRALHMAGLDAREIGYINLHGTGTHLNDAMEAGIVHRVFGDETPCGSTKSLTGHMLGAAGACEAAFVAMSLSMEGTLPPHRWDGERDPALPEIALVAEAGGRSAARHMMSCSYAFGGSNAVLIIGRD